ncbi:SDR family NAD(P)-dependent oxidoreductase [Enterovirga rhinocerotis]|uniref:NAD(P)-dependent dehydrogenase (Short-subunit alcohol dehydrogenase family) n=1 Tax=Enterovirga rhinocerotis TaxID=1339210 RepID=A0A4R7C4J6_9HYPH|nr:glucose 1-dehydrogenase [Enterovirga rhinocerotis]TDR93424.1 NAD(P)-dependent dehydrogenase (short-subunit alcohol dehydrogenase family) [Enterovirga rhinocerotis]
MAQAAGRVAIVTGGGSGIGAEICRRFAQDGLSVVVADRDAANAESVAASIGAGARARTLDVVDEAAVDALVKETAEAFGRLDVMVTSAGIGIQKSMLETTEAEFRRILDINVTGMFLCGRAAARVMVGQGSGRIINIASVAGMRGVPGRVAYSASKGGVIAMTKVMAVELGEHGITVNAIAPGPIETALTERMHTDATRAAYNAASPLGRYGTLAELAAAAAFLASEEASYVTGQTLAVDGGMGVAGPLFKV